MIPRVSGKGGIQAAWRAVTAINTSGLRVGVSGGNRGGVQAVSTQDYTAAYKGIGLETSVDFEAQYAGRALTTSGRSAPRPGSKPDARRGSHDPRRQWLRHRTRTTPTPVPSDVTTGGTLSPNTQYSVICAALTLDGMINGTVVGGVQGQITRMNADGSSGHVRRWRRAQVRQCHGDDRQRQQLDAWRQSDRRGRQWGFGLRLVLGRGRI